MCSAVKMLLELGADANKETPSGIVPLHSAAWYGKADIIPLLLAHNADVNYADKKGWTPLHSAAATSCIEG